MNTCASCGGHLSLITSACYNTQCPSNALPSPQGGYPAVVAAPTNVFNSISVGGAGAPFAAQLVARLLETTTPEPEPEGDPQTVVGIQGWRILQIVSANPLVLMGTNKGHIVSAMTPPAKCANGCKEAPSWHCPQAGSTHGCGYYVLQAPPTNLDDFGAYALAKVSLAGRTIVHDKGWRTFRYRLDELWLPASTVDNTDIDEAEARFGCPIFVLERMLPHGDRATERRRDSGAEGDASEAAADDGAAEEQGAGASRELAT